MTDIFLHMLEITAFSSAIILVVFVFRVIFAKKIRPGVMGMLWALALMRLCLPVMLESPVHLPRLIPQQQEAAVQQPVNESITDSAEIPGAEYEPVSGYSPATVNGLTPQENTAYQPASAERPAAGGFSVDWLAIAAYVWLAGAAAVLITAAWKGISFGRSVKRCGVCRKAARIADELKLALNIRANVPVKVCAGVTAPVLFGAFRPQILLPKSCCGADSETLRCILAHELCHVKRRDILKGYIWLIAKAAHWFNPLVWLAYAACKDDIELSCDDTVLRLIGVGNRFIYTQSLIDAFRSYRHALPASVPLFESKPKLTERVMRMLNPNKRSKAAASLSVVLALIMLVAGFTTACSPAAETAQASVTPQPTAIVQPEPTPVPSQETAAPPEKKPLAEYKTVGHWTDSFTKENSLIKVNADADIVTPEVDTFKSYKVDPGGYIPQALADRIVRVFFGDTPVYKNSGATKESLQKELDDVSGIYKTMQDGTFDFSDYSNKQDMINYVKAQMKRLKDRIKDAPKAADPVPLDTTLKPNEFDGGWFSGVADLGRDQPAIIHLSNHKSGSSVMFINGGGYYGRDKEPYKAPVGNLTITEDDAIKTAEALLAEIGLEDYQLYSSGIRERFNRYILNTGEYAHVLIYSRVVSGIVVSPNTAIPAINSMDYNHEEIRITIDDDGVREFDWKQRFDIDKTEQTEVTLLPIADIEKAIADQIFILYRNEAKNLDEGSGIPKVKTLGYTLNIKEIRLEYAKIPCDGKVKNNRLIPVWNVYGTSDWLYSWEKDGERITENNIDRESNVVLTLSAIDGSMIDFSLAANKGNGP